MRKNITITGGLGYIGTELCKIYSGESWYNKIKVIDNRFISKRVSQLRNWNIEFIQGDILDKQFMKKQIEDADIVHHLAGITNVAYVKAESNSKHDELIRDNDQFICNNCKSSPAIINNNIIIINLIIINYDFII